MANSIKKITDKCFRVLLDAIAGGASVTIGFSDKSALADLSMNAPNWEPNKVDGAIVSLQDAVKVGTPIPTTDVSAAVPVSIVKSGTTHEDFVITVHNDTAATVSGALELYVELGGH